MIDQIATTRRSSAADDVAVPVSDDIQRSQLGRAVGALLGGVPPIETRDHWLAAGLDLLAEECYESLRIDRLASRVGLTKGSFYHHFAGMPAYRGALLDHFEEHATTAFIRAVEEAGDHDPRRRVQRLMSEVLARQGEQRPLEVAFRSWAQHDPSALDMQRRLDGVRVAFVRDLLIDAGLQKAEAKMLARMAYLLQVGGEHVVPPASASELRRCWERLLAPVLA